ncbi:hypothetical protein ACIA8E_27235 [Streptomyces sp. NPDC051664]|uniref:hypothetical protein n=1 Tax=Streptomyces sp. NPDC051664 TaxID=3365668 RepID=UPI00379FE31C
MLHSVVRCKTLGESVEQIRLDLLIPTGKTVESFSEHEHQNSCQTLALLERHAEQPAMASSSPGSAPASATSVRMARHGVPGHTHRVVGGGHAVW